jgi:hypothetical protein
VFERALHGGNGFGRNLPPDFVFHHHAFRCRSRSRRMTAHDVTKVDNAVVDVVQAAELFAFRTSRLYRP